MRFFDPRSDVPGFAEAETRESELRDDAFLGVPEWICGFEVSPLTTRHVLWLSLVNSPFLTKLKPTALIKKPDIAADIARCLRILAPDFSPLAKAKRFRRYRHSVYGNKTGSLEMLQALTGYFDDAFMDSPGGYVGYSKSYYSFAASIVHVLCSRYHLTIDQALDTPLKVVFQLMKVIRKSENPPALLSNRSEQLQSDWLDQRNRPLSRN